MQMCVLIYTGSQAGTRKCTAVPQVPRDPAPHCSPLLPTPPHYSSLLPTAPHCSPLLPIAPHCSQVLQRPPTAPPCSSLLPAAPLAERLDGVSALAHQSQHVLVAWRPS